MTTSNHLFAGAAIALTVQQPVMAVPLALLSHFVMDALPHYGYSGLFGDAFKHKLTWVVESVNLVGVPLLIYLLWGQSIWIYVGALAAVTPDFMWVYRYARYERKGLDPGAHPITLFHKKIQWCERSWGVAIELVLFVLGIVLLVKLVS